jgi:hypothetical protein
VLQVLLEHGRQGLLAAQRRLEYGQGQALPGGPGLAGGRPGLDHREELVGLRGEHAGVLHALAGGRPADKEDAIRTLHPQTRENLLRAMRREGYAFAMYLL